MAHERAQLLRLDGSLIGSRQALQACSLEACPGVVQRDCVRWLDEVSSQIPSVVFEAINEHGAAQKVTVRHGTRTLTEELDGRPIEFDPGYYEFVFELADREPLVVAVLLKQGEKNRLVSVDFRKPVASPAAPSAPAPAHAAPEPLQRRLEPEKPGVPLAVYVLGGTAILSAGAAVALGLNTKAKEDNAYADCAPGCSEERIDDIQRSALYTDIALGVSAVSLLTAVILYVSEAGSGDAARSAPARPNFWLSAKPGYQSVWSALGGTF